jgi:hypothetical protein
MRRPPPQNSSEDSTARVHPRGPLSPVSAHFGYFPVRYAKAGCGSGQTAYRELSWILFRIVVEVIVGD